jgi:hypothetical protein
VCELSACTANLPQLFAQRIEAQRLARMEADWKAAERSRRIKAIAQQEQALREAFNEVSPTLWLGVGCVTSMDLLWPEHKLLALDACMPILPPKRLVFCQWRSSEHA